MTYQKFPSQPGLYKDDSPEEAKLFWITDPTNADRKYVHWRFHAEMNPYPSIVPIVEVTDINPLPKEGWTANDDGSFADPNA